MSDGRASQPPVLVPVDFSPHSLAALVWGSRMSDLLGASLEVLHVVHDPESNPGYYKQGNRSVQRMEKAAAKMMDSFMERAIEDYPEITSLKSAHRELVGGLPVNRILEVAAQRQACLIVMGSQGLSGLPKLLLGSKAQRVVQLSPIPVTIVKAAQAELEGVEI